MKCCKQKYIKINNLCFDRLIPIGKRRALCDPLLMLNLYRSDRPRNAPLFEIDSELNFGQKLKRTEYYGELGALMCSEKPQLILS